MGTLYHRRGTKSFIGTVDGDTVTFRCSCDVFTNLTVAVRMPLASAEALVARKPAREVLAGFPRAAVELFTSGLTEAEFDFAFARSARPLADYVLYEAKPGAAQPAEGTPPTAIPMGRLVADEPRPDPARQLAFLR